VPLSFRQKNQVIAKGGQNPGAGTRTGSPRACLNSMQLPPQNLKRGGFLRQNPRSVGWSDINGQEGRSVAQVVNCVWGAPRIENPHRPEGRVPVECVPQPGVVLSRYSPQCLGKQRTNFGSRVHWVTVWPRRGVVGGPTFPLGPPKNGGEKEQFTAPSTLAAKKSVLP